MSVSAEIKSAMAFWHNKRVVSYALDCIQGLGEAPLPLMINNHHMLLEDYMMLKPGDEATCLINKWHPLVAKKKGCLKDVFQEAIESNLLRPVQYSRMVYFTLKLVVHFNTNYVDFENGNLLQPELSERCTRLFGAGITFYFKRKHFVPITPGDTVGGIDEHLKHQIKFKPQSHCINELSLCDIFAIARRINILKKDLTVTCYR